MHQLLFQKNQFPPHTCLFYMPDHSKRESNYNITDIANFPPLPCGQSCMNDNETTTPSWQKFIETLFEVTGASPNMTLQPNEPIMSYDSGYFNQLETFLNSTPPR